MLGPRDSLFIGPNEGRSIINASNKPATMIVVVNRYGPPAALTAIRRNPTVNPIITASLTGPAALRKDTPAMPRTPEEIAHAAKDAYEAGAAVLHIHLRCNNNFTADLEVAKRTVEAVRRSAAALSSCPPAAACRMRSA